MNWGYIRYVVQNFNKLLMNPSLFKLKRELLFYNHANDEILEDLENDELLSLRNSREDYM